MRILGIDPGQTGGLAIVDFADGGFPVIYEAIPMPVTSIGKKKALNHNLIWNWFSQMDDIDVGVIEAVHAMPKQGVSSSFQFGRMFGAAESMMYDYCQRQAYVSPRVWKKFMNLSSDKGASIDLATRMFGEKAAENYWPLKKHEGVAEAALIAVYWYRKNILGAKK